MTKRLISILLSCFCLMLSGCADTLTAPSAEPEAESALDADAEASLPPAGSSISVAVLGDSIARGYGLSDVENERFSALLADWLHSDFERVSVSNHGVDGMTGGELAEMLATDGLPVLGKCDYVLISVGGNNILRPLYSMSGFTDIVYGLSPQVLSEYFCYLFPPSGHDKSEYAQAPEKLSKFFSSVETLFSGEEFVSIVEKAASELNDELPRIIGEIRRINPTAEIIVQTVYNPYDDLNITLSYVEGSMNLSYFGEQAVSQLNRVIFSRSETDGYTVADVHAEFSASTSTLTNAGFDLGKSFFNIDPHPNALGHTVIARTYKRLITEVKE